MQVQGRSGRQGAFGESFMLVSLEAQMDFNEKGLKHHDNALLKDIQENIKEDIAKGQQGKLYVS